MKHGNATENRRLLLTIPERWVLKLEAVKNTYGALNIQDVIRTIVATSLFPEECMVMKKEAGKA